MISYILTAQKDLIDAKNPTITGGKDGTIVKSTDNLDSFHSTIQTYQALNQPAKEICEAAFQKAKNKNQKVVFIDEDDALKFTQYKVIKNQMDDILKPPPPGEAKPLNLSLTLYAVGALINSVTAFSKLFRTNREVFSEDVTIVPSAWNAALFNQCSQTKTKDQQLKFNIGSMGFDASLLLGESKFMKKVTELKEIKAELGDSKKEEAAKIELLLTSLYKDNGAVLSQLLQSEYLEKEITLNEDGTRIANDGALIAKTEIVKKTGFTMKTSNIWRSDRLYSSGAVAVVYSLSNKDGTVLASDIVINETELKEVQKLP